MSLRHKMILATALLVLDLVMVAGMFGYIEHLDDQLVEAGINLTELVK
jgi:hypothetical protein